MRPNAGILIFISLLLLVGAVEALQPDSITFNSNPEWVIANGIDQSAITVTIKSQSQNVTLSSSSVTFSPDSLGTMHPTNVITNSNGEATSNFNAYSVLIDKSAAQDHSASDSILGTLGILPSSLIPSPDAASPSQYLLILGYDYEPCFRPEKLQ